MNVSRILQAENLERSDANLAHSSELSNLTASSHEAISMWIWIKLEAHLLSHTSRVSNA